MGGCAAALPVYFPLSTRGARPHHGAMAYGPVDACSCFCEADVMPEGRFAIFHESHDLARCSKWAHLHFSSACASMQTRCASPLPLLAPFALLSGRWVTCHLQARVRRVPRGRSPPRASLMSLLSLKSLNSCATRATAQKPWKGVQNTAGGERSVTPGKRVIIKNPPSLGRGKGVGTIHHS